MSFNFTHVSSAQNNILVPSVCTMAVVMVNHWRRWRIVPRLWSFKSQTDLCEFKKVRPALLSSSDPTHERNLSVKINANMRIVCRLAVRAVFEHLTGTYSTCTASIPGSVKLSDRQWKGVGRRMASAAQLTRTGNCGKRSQVGFSLSMR